MCGVILDVTLPVSVSFQKQLETIISSMSKSDTLDTALFYSHAWTGFLIIQKPLSFFFILFIAYRFGDVKFGSRDEKPEFTDSSFFAMILYVLKLVWFVGCLIISITQSSPHFYLTICWLVVLLEWQSVSSTMAWRNLFTIKKVTGMPMLGTNLKMRYECQKMLREFPLLHPYRKLNTIFPLC